MYLFDLVGFHVFVPKYKTSIYILLIIIIFGDNCSSIDLVPN